LTVSNHTMIFMAASMSSDTSGIISGLSVGAAADQFTVDGNNFNPSLEVQLIETVQSSANGPDASSFGVTGTIGSINGVGFSSDGGLTFKTSDVASQTDARYGSFPAADTWFVSCGQWPSNDSDSKSLAFQLTSRFSLPVDMVVIRDNNLTWAAGIQKTDDAGATWTNVFWDETFYFNEIACPDAKNCFVVGENDDSAFIYNTKDGGKTWQQQGSFPGVSLLACAALSAEEAWAGGGVMDSSFTGHAYHTTDGGATWNLETAPGIYFNHFSFVDSDHAYATAFNALQQSSIAKYA